MGGISYLDFDLFFQRAEGQYHAQVNSPAGQAAVTFSLPFSDIELENFLLRVGRTRRVTRRIDSPEVKAAKEFGERLFSAVFVDEVRGCLRSSLEEARQQGAGLRIRLHLTGAPELVDLPWEYLYNSALNRFLNLSVDTPVVRYMDLPERIQPLPVSPPLQVLVMISSPHDYPALEVEQEWGKVRDALGELVQRGLVSLERLPEPRLSTLQRYLRRGTYHVFHFIGHGGFDANAQDGVLVLEDEDGRGRPVSGQDLGVMLHDHRSMRLAVLNACEGARTSRTDPFAGTAQSLVQQGLAAVIAMQFEITDEAAITFAHEFYGAVADGYPVDAALVEARKAIFAEDNGLEWGTPVLYLRAPDGRVFDVDRARDAPPTPGTATADVPVSRGEVRRPPAPVEVGPRPQVSRPPTPLPVEPGGAVAHRRRVPAWVLAAAPLVVAAGALFMWSLGQTPEIERFAAEPTVVVQGGGVTLRWVVRDASTVEIAPPVGARALDPREGQVSVRPAAAGPQTFALTARRGRHAVQRAVMVTVKRRPPSITSFRSAPEREGGRRLFLSWEVVDATEARIDPQPGPVRFKGSILVDVPPPNQPVTYRLTVSNPDNPPVEKVLAVTAAPRPPAVSRFDAQPFEVKAGQQTVLSWNVAGAETVTISGIGTVRAPSGSVVVRPQSTERYALTASNAHGTVTQSLTVRVRSVSIASSPQPTGGTIPRRTIAPTRVSPVTPRISPSLQTPSAEVREFGATPLTVNLGETTQLCWTTLNARGARIEPDFGDVDARDVAKGCRSIAPKQTTTFTLTVTGADGRTASSQFTVEVRAAEAHVDLTASKASLIIGESTQLCWLLFNARSARLDPSIGDLPPSELEKGCRSISPKQTTVYTMTVVGRDGRTVTRQLTVDVRVVEVQIREFVVRTAVVRPGDTAQLCWVVVNARSVRIDPEPGELGRLELEKGCREISPRQTTRYFLTAVGPDGKTVTQNVLVVVALR